MRKSRAGGLQRMGVMLAVWPVLLLSGTVWALDINQASVAELQSLKGIGPQLAGRIVTERARAPFSSFGDLAQRVKGVGQARVRAWQRAGVTVKAAQPVLIRPRAGAGRAGMQRPSPAAADPAASRTSVELIQGGVDSRFR